MSLSHGGCSTCQATAVRADEQIHPVVLDEPFDEPLDLSALTVVISDDELEANAAAQLWNEEATVLIGVLEPEAKPLQRLLTL